MTTTAVSLPTRCPMVGGNCSLQPAVIQQFIAKKPYSFFMLPYLEKYDDTEKVYSIVTSGGKFMDSSFRSKRLNRKKVTPTSARKERFVGEGTCKICCLCWFADYGVAELGNVNPCVLMEVGLMWGFGKKVVLTLHKGYTPIDQVPFDIGNQMLVVYESLEKLAQGLDSKMSFLLGTI